jgi:hypothetical protein
LCCRENGRLRWEAGASLWLSEVRQENAFTRALLSAWPSRPTLSTVACGSSAWQKAAKGERARRGSRVRRLLPPPAQVSPKPIMLGSMRLSSMWPVERFAVPGSPTGAGKRLRCFPWLGPSRRLGLLLVHPVPSVGIRASVGMIGSHLTPAGDHRRSVSLSQVFPLFSPPASRGRKQQTKRFHQGCVIALGVDQEGEEHVSTSNTLPFVHAGLLTIVEKYLFIKETRML